MLAAIAAMNFMVARTDLEAQVRDRPARSTPAESHAAAIARGWSALAAGQPDAAVRAVAALLKRAPWNHAANALRIEALAAADPVRGLDAYEAWLGTRTVDDVALLEPVPRATLLQLARDADADIQREARRLLARAGVRIESTPDAEKTFDADAARASRGDAAALKRLETAASSAMVHDKTAVADALEAAGPAGVPGLITLLGDNSGPARGRAAAALGRLHAENSIEALQKAMTDEDPFVKSSAAVALARLNDPNGRSYVQQMLDSPVPDLQLMAAEAWDGQSGPWVAVITPLLKNKDGLIRLHAARLIAPVDPDLARSTLQEAATDPNPVIRAEAARATAEVTSVQPLAASIPELRRLLRDADPQVRLQAAGALLAAARGGR